MVSKQFLKELALVIAGSILGLLFLFFAAFGGLNFLIYVPKPAVKYAEFPFTLIYEVKGEQKTISDVIVCEYDGTKVLGEAGKYRQWKSYIKSTGSEHLTILDLRPRNEINEFGQTMLELHFDYGSPAYYMGDKESRYVGDHQDFSYIEYIAESEEGLLCGSFYSAFEAMVRYDIKLISWECAPPIENSFK